MTRHVRVRFTTHPYVSLDTFINPSQLFPPVSVPSFLSVSLFFLCGIYGVCRKENDKIALNLAVSVPHTRPLPNPPPAPPFFASRNLDLRCVVPCMLRLCQDRVCVCVCVCVRALRSVPLRSFVRAYARACGRTHTCTHTHTRALSGEDVGACLWACVCVQQEEEAELLEALRRKKQVLALSFFSPSLSARCNRPTTRITRAMRV